MGIGIQRHDGLIGYEGLRRVNLKPSKPLCQIVSNLQTLVSRYMGHRGYRGYMYMKVCSISFEYPAKKSGAKIKAGNIKQLISNHSTIYNMPGGYLGYMGYGGLKGLMV